MKKFVALGISIVALLTVQFGTISIASADVDTDLRITGSRSFENKAIEFRVCNDGPTEIKEIVLSINSTNLAFDYIDTSLFNDAPSAGLGSFDAETLTWTGSLKGPVPDDPGTTEVNESVPAECVPFVASGEFTAGIGATVTTSVSIVSATQVDDTVNTDTNPGNETLVYDEITIAPSPDLVVDSHLATTGEITETTEVTYQVDVTNEGVGDFVATEFFIFVFILPPDATFVDVEDLNESDALSVEPEDPDDPDNCFSPGTVGQVGVGTGLSAYNDRVVMLCNLSVTGDGKLPPNSTIYPFAVNIIAGPSLAAGTADVVGLIEGNDIDTLELMKTLVQGGDPLTIGSNNVFNLAYDQTELQATVNRCPGQGPTTADGTGCFRITFNKLIYAPSFGFDDINLGGNGSVSSLTQIDDLTWELRVIGIAPNSTLTLLLNLNQIQDYSAQQNSTQVLGINTIRYDVSGATTGTASGSLPATGANASISIVALIMMLIGFTILKTSRRKLTIGLPGRHK